MKNITLLKIYLAGLAVNVIFVIILTNNPVTFRNIQSPEGEYADNIWEKSDVHSYINSARNYIKHGVFGKGDVPGYYRQIGYPAFIAAIMSIFKEDWLIALFLIQAAVFALIYPTLVKIREIILPRQKYYMIFTFLFLLVSGTYFLFTPVILSDMFFTVFFVIGLYFSLLAMKKTQWKYLVFQLLFTGYAALIRPTLILYPIVNVFVMLSMVSLNKTPNRGKVRNMIIVATVGLLVLVNVSALRNYINHGVFLSTNVGARVLSGPAWKIIQKPGKEELYSKFLNDLETARETGDMHENTSVWVENSIDIYKKYPLALGKNLALNVGRLTLKNHLTLVGRFLGVCPRDNTPKAKSLGLKQSNILLAICILLVPIYAGIYLGFIALLIRLVFEKKYLYSFTLVIFMLNFYGPAFIVPHKRYILPVEGLVVMFAFYEIERLWCKFRNKKPITHNP